MFKKGLLGAALGAGTLYLVFGTSAPTYVRTAFHKGRHNAKSAVPVQFEIDKTREEIANLEPAIKENIETYAREEVEVEALEGEIHTTQANLAAEKRTLLALTEKVRTGDFRLAGRRATRPMRSGSTSPAGSTTTRTSSGSSRRRRRPSSRSARGWPPSGSSSTACRRRRRRS